MTQPVPHGFPDWGRFDSSADKVYIRFDESGLTGNFSLDPLFVGDVSHVGISCVVTQNAAYMAIDWYEDEGLTSALWSDTIEFAADKLCVINLPVRGPYLSIAWEPQATPYNILGRITSAKSGKAAIGAADENVLISRLNIAIGAGAVVSSTSFRIIPGPAIWNVFVTSTTWTAAISGVHPDGTTIRLDTINQTVGHASRPLYLPACSLVLTITNTSAAAAAFNCAVMAKPLYDGT